MNPPTKVLVENLIFPEGPRWHSNKLWFSDMHDHKVMTVDIQGNVETIVRVPGQPSGLGWLPDGRLQVVSMIDRRLLRLDVSGLSEVANLSDQASYHCNDMVVDSLGRAYVGNFGFDLFVPEPEFHKLAEIILVMPDGDSRIVAKDMSFPNGMVILPGGGSLIVAESMASRLTSFDISENGSLTNRRIWAQLPTGVIPDGICLDAEGAIWVASPLENEVIRVLEDGEIVNRIKVESSAFACALGGHDRRTLFILSAATSEPNEAKALKSGRIEVVEVEVPGAGLP